MVRVNDGPKALALTADVTPRYCEADPFEGGKQAVAEAWRNLTAVGARPLALTDNLNFGNPERPEIMGQFVGCVRGIAEACKALDFPVVSGNVSLYNETNGRAILPTPTIGGVGVLDDFTKSATLAFKARRRSDPADRRDAGLARPVALSARDLRAARTGAPPPVDLVEERENGDFVRALIADGRVTAAHDLSDGGLLVALAEMAMASGIGATLDAAPERHAGACLLVRRGSGALCRHGCARPMPSAVIAAVQQAWRASASDRHDRRRRLAISGERPVPVKRWPSASKAGFRPIWRALPPAECYAARRSRGQRLTQSRARRQPGEIDAWLATRQSISRPPPAEWCRRTGPGRPGRC